ncbi:hypothetical protein FRC08_009885 [Ceratobasidium sp. 394]|nr:hypothetical protein FRC08_009885 [Ceratobasidium sp. 394]
MIEYAISLSSQGSAGAQAARAVVIKRNRHLIQSKQIWTFKDSSPDFYCDWIMYQTSGFVNYFKFDAGCFNLQPVWERTLDRRIMGVGGTHDDTLGVPYGALECKLRKFGLRFDHRKETWGYLVWSALY